MKKFFLSIICVLLLSHHGLAFNVLQENEKYRRELNSLSGRQHAENIKHLHYYKGPVNYVGSYSSVSSGSSSTKKDIYVKKGVKFKVDTEKQEQRLKEAQSTQEKVTAKEIEEKQELQSDKPSAKQVQKIIKSESKEKNEKKITDVTKAQVIQKEKPKVQQDKKFQQKMQLDIPKVNVNGTVKNLAQPLKKKAEPKSDMPQIPLGKNADAE